MVCCSQTVEDGAPREPVSYTIHEHDGEQYVRSVVPIRDPGHHGVMAEKLVVRDFQVSGRSTATLSALHVEEPRR